MATRTLGRYHCVVCSEECDRRAVRCGDCGRMTHIDCVRFCEYVLGVRPIDFVCRTFVYNGDDYDWEKALIRLVCIYYETLYTSLSLTAASAAVVTLSACPTKPGLPNADCSDCLVVHDRPTAEIMLSWHDAAEPAPCMGNVCLLSFWQSLYARHSKIWCTSQNSGRLLTVEK